MNGGKLISVEEDITYSLHLSPEGMTNVGAALSEFNSKLSRAIPDHSIWQNTYTYSFNSNYSELQPSYSSVSHLNFWPESGAAVLPLGFEWNSDSQTVFVASDFNGTGDYNISLDFSEDFSLVVITINSLSHFNLKPWGGTEDGWLSAEYYLEK